MKVLLIAPLPPPITGHSLASQLLLDSLAGTHQTAAINLSVGSRNDGRVSARRIREVGKVLRLVWRYRRWADVTYFTISESRAGDLKDLLVYLLCVRRLGRLFVHLHGGTIGRALFDRHALWRRLNAWFIGRLDRCSPLGEISRGHTQGQNSGCHVGGKLLRAPQSRREFRSGSHRGVVDRPARDLDPIGGPEDIIDDRVGILLRPGDEAGLGEVLSTMIGRSAPDPEPLRAYATARYGYAAVGLRLRDFYCTVLDKV